MGDDSLARMMDAEVAQLSAMNLRMCELFSRLGLGFLEAGHLKVSDACRLRHIDQRGIAAALAIRGASDSPPAPNDHDFAGTCRLVECHHHGPLRASLGGLRTCLAAACGRIEHVAPSLAESRRLLEALAESLLVHFAKEENILFPAFAALEDARRRNGPRPPLPFSTVLHPIRAMEAEHDRIMSGLRQLIDLVDQAQPGGQFEIAQECGSQLECFSRELIAHANFENDFLFVKGLELEEQGGWGW